MVNIGVVDSLVLVFGIIDTVCVVFSELVVGAVGSAVTGLFESLTLLKVYSL